MDINYDKLATNDNSCIDNIKQELNIDCNYKAGKLVGRVLHTIRDSLTYSQSAELIQKLPDDLKIIYVSDWKLNHRQLRLKHLDNLVEEVIKNDQRHAQQVLHGEVSALYAILITLKILNRYVDILAFDFFNYSLKRELAEAMTEAA
ncbi:hypothetical protein C900_01332 [Fulvivirga imtechensis AK7]|uniref:Uncharacterized protein n=1 Tax=Fulvivirga imtechensis AK7 TaxID=1237149 RepID=L8K2P5_9BACT|nr:DUF2267 domain-containing protein [Fulvivirga imtechensis]ELR73722.1 hypothetical protein C900_01332 [Fulvivirga imtechensis AK7]